MSLIDQIEALGYETDIGFLPFETATRLLLEFSHGELTAASAQDLILHWQTARDRYETEVAKGNDMRNEKRDPDELQEEKDSIDRIERRRAGGS